MLWLLGAPGATVSCADLAGEVRPSFPGVRAGEGEAGVPGCPARSWRIPTEMLSFKVTARCSCRRVSGEGHEA